MINQALSETKINDLKRYGDITYHELHKTLADKFNLTESNILLGAGADDVLDLIFRTYFKSGDSLLLPNITYPFYENYAQSYGYQVTEVLIDDRLQIDLEPYINSPTNCVIVNPNAPSGHYHPVSEIELVVKRYADRLVIVDEAYIDFGGESVISLVKKYDNLIVVQTFSKSRNLAGDSDALTAYFSTFSDDLEVQADAQSGDYLFGRGMLDMKSGVAVNLVNILYFSEHLDELPGNLFLYVNPVEENDHTGIIEATNEIKQLQSKGYEFVTAINTDFVSPLYQGDQTRYVYTGAAGKILPCFYIKGRETHVGSTLQGIDPTLISSAINLAINTNLELCETISDEEIVPSSALYQRDCKDFYNVQTAKTAQLYFNAFLYEESANQVLENFAKVAQSAITSITDNYKIRLSRYQESIGISTETDINVSFYRFSQYCQYLDSKGFDSQKLIADFVKEYGSLDRRQAGFDLINYLEFKTGEDTPKVILFLAPPFCPHNFIDSDSQVNQVLDRVITEFSGKETFKKRRFFPYLSDSSYLAMRETSDEIKAMLTDFPMAETLYPVPFDTIRSLNIPAIDLGVYGKGAHTRKERLYKPYSYRVLPEIIRSFTKKY